MVDAGTSLRDRLEDLWGCSVFDRDDERIGTFEAVFYGAGDVEAEWLAIGVGLLGRRLVVVPANGVVMVSFALKLPFSRGFVKDAPELRHDDLDPKTMQAAREYFSRVPL
jgi:hypothetical protein